MKMSFLRVNFLEALLINLIELVKFYELLVWQVNKGHLNDIDPIHQCQIYFLGFFNFNSIIKIFQNVKNLI
jgi:hypothetical protein